MRTIDDLAELTALVGGCSEVYIRYSQGPAADAAGPSRDYEAGVPLPGLPVTCLHPESWWPRAPEDWIARRICKYQDLSRGAPERWPWLLTGRVVGAGPDHEPLLRDVTPIAWVGSHALEQARRAYHERFDVGRAAADA